MVEKLADWIEKSNHWITPTLLFIVFIVGMVYSFSLGDRLRFFPDEDEYIRLADGLVKKGMYTLDGNTPTALRPPGYPIFLAALRLLGLNLVGVRVAQYALLILSIFLLSRILKSISSSFAAVLGVILALGYGVLFYTAGAFYPQNLAAFLFVWLLCFFVHPMKLRWWGFIAMGLLAAWLSLTVATFLAFVPALAGAILWQTRSWRGAALFLVASLVVIGIWTGRNYVAMKGFIPISANSGTALLMGNSEKTTPNGGALVDLSKYYQEAQGKNEVEWDAHMRASAFEYIRANPRRSFTLYLLKVLNYFNYRNELATAAETSTARDLLMLFTYGPLLLLGVARLALAFRYKLSWYEVLLVGLYLYSAFVHAVFITRIRFRLPFDYLLIILAAIALDYVVRSQVQRAPKKLIAP